MLPQIKQAPIIRQILLHEVTGCLREEHLPAVPGTHDACSPMHIQAHIAFGSKLRLARVQTHTHTYDYAFWPGMAGESTLRVYCCRESIRGTSKDHEEGISLGVDFMPAPVLEGSTQQVSALCEHAGVA